jgi:DNA-binding PadR family transcriptional regulator
MSIQKRSPRLSTTEERILDLLIREDEMFGLQIVQASHGGVKRGTVYVTLGRMQDKGFVESRTEPPVPGAIGLPRRLYRPTAYGVAVHRAWAQASRAIARLKPARLKPREA